jgi:hypothetical protein
MRVLALLVLAALVAAGCSDGPGKGAGAGPGPTEPPPPGPWYHRADGSAASALDFPGEAPVFVSVTLAGVWGWEPSVALSHQAIFLATEGNRSTPDDSGLIHREVEVVRSRDNGTTWEVVSPPASMPPATSLDPFLTRDVVTGRLYADHLRVDCTTLSWSDDEGETWRSNPLGCGNPFEDHQSLFTGPAQGLPSTEQGRVLHLCSNQLGTPTCKASLDGGLTFLGPRLPFGSDDCLTGSLGHGIASEATGTVFLGHTNCGRARIARSVDDGQTWSVSLAGPSTSCSHDVSIAIDDAGTVYAAYLGPGPDVCLPRLAASKDDGATWQEDRSAGRGDLGRASHLALAAGAAGRVAISYLGANDSAPRAATEWSLYVTLGLAADGPDASFATVDAAGRPLVAGPTPGSAGTQMTQGVGDFLDVAAGPADGRIVASLADTCKGACLPSGDRVAYGRLGAAIQIAGTGLR